MKRLLIVGLSCVFFPCYSYQARAQVSPALVQEGIRACISAPVLCSVVVTAGGLVMWEYISPSGSILVPIPPRYRRQIEIPHRLRESQINDPEREEWVTDEESILADSLEEARRECKKIARRIGLEVQSIKPPSRKNGKRYVCKFGGFLER